MAYIIWKVCRVCKRGSPQVSLPFLEPPRIVPVAERWATDEQEKPPDNICDGCREKGA